MNENDKNPLVAAKGEDMVSVILACSDEVKEKALEAGFVEQSVLVKYDAVLSNAEEKGKLESALFKLKPFQFLVADFWGMGPG